MASDAHWIPNLSVVSVRKPQLVIAAAYFFFCLTLGGPYFVTS